jgi:nucleotide-binding universal stress UspA family protein
MIAYDGSKFAKAAVEDAARQLGPGREAIILTVSEPLEAIPFLGFGGVAVNQDAVDAISAETERGAKAVVEEGVQLARNAGLDARPLIEIGMPVWRRIVDVAEEQGVGLIVIGSHGRSGLGYALLGSVATAVTQHCRRSVLVVHGQS